MILWLVSKLEISYRVLIYLEGFWFLLEDFFEDYIFCMVKYLSFRFCLKIPFNANGKATVWHTPCFNTTNITQVSTLHYKGPKMLQQVARPSSIYSFKNKHLFPNSFCRKIIFNTFMFIAHTHSRDCSPNTHQ
jgi:hypothetical protein